MLLECAMKKQVQQYQQDGGVLAGDKIIDVPWKLETSCRNNDKTFQETFCKKSPTDIFCFVFVLTNVMYFHKCRKSRTVFYNMLPISELVMSVIIVVIVPPPSPKLNIAITRR